MTLCTDLAPISVMVTPAKRSITPRGPAAANA
jgi:hypothetical protein